MTPRSVIFISAVSSELRSARQLVANTLTFLGYEPVWQDVFGTESGDLREMLRKQIDQCKGVVQLVGKCYGAEPPTPDEKLGRVSYTQYEALYARERGKKVWYLFIDDSFPRDRCGDEPEALQSLQAKYRERVQSDTHVFHPLASQEALEAGVLKLRDELGRLRRGVRRWALGVTALLVFVSIAIVWLVQGQRHQGRAIQKQGEEVTAIVDRYQKMQQALMRLAVVEAQAKQPGEKLTPEEQRDRAYTVLEKELGLSDGTLAKELPAFALELYNRSDVTPLERARAAYALNKFDEAEKLSLEGAEQDQKSYETAKRVAEDKRKSALEGYELAGLSAEKRIQYAEALVELHKAEQLTDRSRDPLEWARIQFGIGKVLQDQGNDKEAERLLREVLQERERHLGPEHSETLAARDGIASAWSKQGKVAEGETEFRAVLKLREKVLGPEHPDTLTTRNNLAKALNVLGKSAEAEAQFREVLKLREKVLGAESPETLNIHNNLATVLYSRGKYAEAESEFRNTMELEEKVLGPEHPNTLAIHNNLAAALDAEGKYAEAEAEYREVLKIQQRVLGPEHPSTLHTRDSLAAGLSAQGKYAEAEAEYRVVIPLEHKVLGPEDSLTLESRTNLADALRGQRRYTEAEAEYREVITLQEKVLGSEDAETLLSSYDLALCLRDEGKLSEAKKFASRAAEGARKVVGIQHPDTKKYEKLSAELEAKH